MRMERLLRSAGALACAIVASCGAVTLTAPGPDCTKVPVHATIRFDGTHMWAEDQDTGATMNLAARRDTHWSYEPGPPPALVDPVAKSVIHDGDIIYGACHDDMSNTDFIGPDDVPNHEGGA